MRATLYVTAAALLTALLFIEAPRLDLVLARQFGSGEGYRLRYDPLALAINRMIPLLVYGGCAALVSLTALRALGRPMRGCGFRTVGFLALSLILGPGLIVNALLKTFSGRPRPFDLTRFGGSQRFEPAFDFGGACASNCSFVSGDASAAFALVAVALVLPSRYCMPAIVAALAFGAAIGFVRIVQGAHFLSDVVFAGFFTVLPILVLHHVLIERGWPRFRKLDAPLRVH